MSADPDAAVPVEREALRQCAQALAWLAFGECRGWHDRLPTAKEALEAARAALAAPQAALTKPSSMLAFDAACYGGDWPANPVKHKASDENPQRWQEIPQPPFSGVAQAAPIPQPSMEACAKCEGTDAEPWCNLTQSEWCGRSNPELVLKDVHRPAASSGVAQADDEAVPTMTLHIFMADGRREASITTNEEARGLPLGDHTFYLRPAPAAGAASPVGEVYRYGRGPNGQPWHGIHWYDNAVDVPHGTKLFTQPQGKK